MKLVRNDPKPVPPPQPTFDITGLTVDEAEKIMALIGTTSCRVNDPFDRLYMDLSRELGRKGLGSYYKIVDRDGKHIDYVDFTVR
jgi:hypothetical protein